MTVIGLLAAALLANGPPQRDTLHVVADPPGGTPVVFLPGLFGAAYGFRQVAPLFRAAGYRVIIVEPLGVGSSGRPDTADYSLAAQSERIARVIDTLKAGPVFLVAHSLGGAIAFRIAVRHPELVKGILSLEGGPTEEATTEGFRKAMKFAPLLRLFGGRMVRSKVHGMLKDSSGDPSWVTDDAVHGYTDGATKDLGATIRAYKAMGRAREPGPLAPELGRIRCPVRMIIGGAPHDGGVDPQETALLARSLASFTIDSVAGVGHYVHEEKPLAVLQSVRRLEASVKTSTGAPAEPEDQDAHRTRR
jgi:pimeloyl-ACP methyl ester carboxylesterase